MFFFGVSVWVCVVVGCVLVSGGGGGWCGVLGVVVWWCGGGVCGVVGVVCLVVVGGVLCMVGGAGRLLVCWVGRVRVVVLSLGCACCCWYGLL